MAERVGISRATAPTHIQRILVKLGAHNRISALAIAITGAPVDPGGGDH